MTEIKFNVLIAEDEENIGNFISTILKTNGYKPIIATTGTQAIQCAESYCPDIILLDLGLPDMDGIDVISEIRKWAVTPIIVISARNSESEKVKALDAGADDYITKPFDVEVLRSKVNSLLKRRDEMRRFYTSNPVGAHPEGEKTVKKDDSPSNLFMDAVISTIEKHLDDPSFEAKILADSLNMSLPTLYRKIKLYSDSSILELTRMVRLKKAAELISMQRYSIQEVSEMVLSLIHI